MPGGMRGSGSPSPAGPAELHQSSSMSNTAKLTAEDLQAAVAAMAAEEDRRSRLLQALRLAEERRALSVAASKKFLVEKLSSIETQAKEVMESWRSADEFSKVDIICAELMKAGNFVDALAYMRSVGGLVDRVVDRLQAKVDHLAAQAAQVKVEEVSRLNMLMKGKPARGAGGTSIDGATSSAAAMFNAKLASASTARVRLLEAEADKLRNVAEENARRAKTAEATAASLDKQLEAARSLLEKERADRKTVVERKVSAGAAQQDRLQARTQEMSAAIAAAEVATRRASDYAQQLDGALSMVKAAQEAGRKEAAKTARLRDKLAAAELMMRAQGKADKEDTTTIEADMRLVAACAARDTAAAGRTEALAAAAAAEAAAGDLRERLSAQAVVIQDRDDVIRQLTRAVDALEAGRGGGGETGAKAGRPLPASSASPYVVVGSKPGRGAVKPSTTEAVKALPAGAVLSTVTPGVVGEVDGTAAAASSETEAVPVMAGEDGPPETTETVGPLEPDGAVASAVGDAPRPRRVMLVPRAAPTSSRPGLDGAVLAAAWPAGVTVSPQHLVRLAEYRGTQQSIKWVVHQAARCEPARAVLVSGVDAIRTVDVGPLGPPRGVPLCACKYMGAVYLEMAGAVSWSKKACVIGPPPA